MAAINIVLSTDCYCTRKFKDDDDDDDENLYTS